MRPFITERLFLVLLFCFTAAASAEAQFVKVDSTSNWKKAFKGGLNLNQAAFSSNWKAGGVNSLGFNAFANYKANYKKDKRSWDNELDFLYGMVNNKGQGYRKTLDRIFMDTKYGHSLSKVWDVFLAANLQSQFAKGYSYGTDAVTQLPTQTLISRSFSPTFITASLGMEYHPTDYFKLRLSPLAPRVTIVNDAQSLVTPDNPKPYGVNPTGNTRFEWLAFQMLAEFNKDIATNINLKWRYVMFANYQTLEPKTIDHRVDVTLTAKVNKFINVNLGGILLYDFDQSSGVQLSQAFSFGLLYTFQNYADKK
jgi:Protein of unknown function (DUF3078)